jgi:AsmA protein
VRITLFGLAAIAILGAIIVFVGPLLISTDDLRDSLFAQVESATGYRLRVSGPIQVSLFPSLDLVAEDVGIAPGGEGDMAEMATARSLRFGLQLSALIGGKVKMTEVTLVDPVIAVPETKDAAGTAKGGVPQVSSGSPAAALKSLSLDRLLIKNGTLILPGSGRGSGRRIEAFSLEASLPTPDATLTFEGSALVEGQKIQAAGSLGGLAQLLDGEAVPLSLTVDAPSYLAETTVLNGIASYKGDSFVFSQFTARAGDKSLTGGGSYRGSILTLHPLTLNVGGNSLSGSVAADLSGAVPAVNAAFSGKTLNLDALLGKPASAAVPAGSDAAASVGWSDEKIDFSGLRSVTAKLKLSTGQLIYNNITISNATLQATVARGKLNATLARFQLYGGAGAAALDVDASGKIATQRVRLSLAKFDAYPFLKDSTGFQSIEGTGAISLDLTASGASQRAMVSGLNGAAKLEFTDGAIRGINIAKTMRGLTTGILSGWQENAAEKTDFATLGASFKIARGLAQTADLKLVGPLVRMAGAGTVDLPGRALKFRVDPQIVASLEGQGGNADLQGLGVPIVIAGPWDRPSIYPDIEGILKNPAAAYEQLNRLDGGLVSLPGTANTGSVSAIGGLIKNGKVGTDALPQGALGGIGALLGGQKQSADEPQQTDAAAAANAKAKPKPVSDAAPKEAKKSKKRQAAAEPSRSPEDTARQLMQNFLGN